MPPPPQSIHPTSSSSSLTSSPKAININNTIDDNSNFIILKLREQLELLQDQFQRLEQSSLEIEAKQEIQIQELTSLLRVKENSLQLLKHEHHEDLIKLKERDDEIKYLQVELESSIAELEKRDQERLFSHGKSNENLSSIGDALNQYTLIHQRIQSLASPNSS